MPVQSGLNRQGVVAYPAEPRPKELPTDTAYAVRPDFVNSNFRMIAEAIGCMFFTGLHYKCFEGSAYFGASSTTHCRLTLPTDYTEIGDVVFVGEGSRVWRVVITQEDQIEFSDSNLVHGSTGTANYNLIKTSLQFMTRANAKISKVVTKNEIALGSFAEGLHADDIQISDVIATTIKDLYDDFYTDHETDGSHSAGVIDNDDLNKNDVMITHGFINRIRNGAFNIKNGAGLPTSDYWSEVGSPNLLIVEGAVDEFPQHYVSINTSALTEGIEQELWQCEPTIPLRLVLYARKSGTAGAVSVIMYTDNESAQTDITLTDTFTKYYLTFTPTIMPVRVRIVSNTASAMTFYVALVSVAYGDIHTQPERSPQDTVLDMILTKTFYVEELKAGSDIEFVRWTLLGDIRVLYSHVLAATVPDANVYLRLTNGVTDIDVLCPSGTGVGSNDTQQDYNVGDTMQVFVLTNASTTGGKCTLVIQYRKR